MPRVGSITFTPGEYSIANNKTPLNIKGIIKTTGDAWKGDHRTGTITVTQDGSVIYNGSFTHGAPLNSTTTLFEIKIDVKHKSDGSSGVIAASYNYDSGWCKASSSTTLAKIPRNATIASAPNFNDEENPSITYSNPAGTIVTSLQACISLNRKAADVPYRDIDKNGTSYTFNLTDEERKTLRLATTGSNSRTVIFFVKTVISGTTIYDTLERTFSIINGKPTLEPSVIDVNEKTKVLTGDNNILVRYFSDAQVNAGTEVYKEATIKSQKVICGSKSINQGSGTIEKVGSGAFIFSATDNRENAVTETVNVPFIEYVSLTCNLNANAPDAEGDVNFRVSGNCFGGSFGAVDNVVKVYYRYKANSDEYSEDWVQAENVVVNDDNTYVAEVNLSGLDYTNKYTFQAKASDSLMEISSIEKAVKTIPVFDWGENDFNFNVPVNVNGEISIDGVKMADYIVEEGTSGIWHYTKWASGKCELYCRENRTAEIQNQNGNMYRSDPFYIGLPFTVYQFRGWVTCFDQNAWATMTSIGTNASSIGYTIFRGAAFASYTWPISVLVKGRWKE